MLPRLTRLPLAAVLLLAGALLRADDEQPNVKVGPAVIATGPDLSPAAQFKDLTQQIVAASPTAKVAPLASTNMHLGGAHPIVSPFTTVVFAQVTGGQTPAGPVRQFAALRRVDPTPPAPADPAKTDPKAAPAADPKAAPAKTDPKVATKLVPDPAAAKPVKPLAYPLDLKEQFPALIAKEDTSKWTGEQWLQAGQVYMHLTTPANVDGWKLLTSSDDFMAIQVNMSDHLAPQKEARLAAAGKISRPQVIMQGGVVSVSFHTWQLIGGHLRQWTIQFKPTFAATYQDLGHFGGGGYD